jgi:hypothetical protein
MAANVPLHSNVENASLEWMKRARVWVLVNNMVNALAYARALFDVAMSRKGSAWRGEPWSFSAFRAVAGRTRERRPKRQFLPPVAVCPAPIYKPSRACYKWVFAP